jgi:hypothetical protein
MELITALAFAPTPCLGGAQVSDLRARHTGGQTILTWKDVAPGFSGESASVADLLKIRKELAGKVRYRVYRAAAPIRSLDGPPVGEAAPLSGWDLDLYGTDPRPGDGALRHVVDEGKGSVAPGTAVFAHNPAAAGRAGRMAGRRLDLRQGGRIGPCVGRPPRSRDPRGGDRDEGEEPGADLGGFPMSPTGQSPTN